MSIIDYRSLARQYGKSHAVAASVRSMYGFYGQRAMKISREADDKAATWWRRLIG